MDLDELAGELEEFAPPEKKGGRPAREERIIAGFEDIQRFFDQHGRVPQHGEDRDIFERLYAVRLDRLRSLAECRAILEPLDHQGLLADAPAATEPSADYNVEDLAAELGGSGAESISVLRHVRTSAEKRAAEEIADRKPCADFKKFKPLFEHATADLRSGFRQAKPIEAGNRSVEVGDFFIIDGLTVYVAEVGEPLKTTAGEVDRRLRVIYSNGTESNLLLRSLQRAFYADTTARRLISPKSGQLSFGGEFEADDVESGTIYVLRSRSDHPYVAQHRELIHKVGVTGSSVEARRERNHLPARRGRGSRDLQAGGDQPDPDGEAVPQALRGGPAGHHDQRSERPAGETGGVVPGTAVRDRRGRDPDQGRQHHRLRLRSQGSQAGEALSVGGSVGQCRTSDTDADPAGCRSRSSRAPPE
jgi:hypothetical protein